MTSISRVSRVRFGESVITDMTDITESDLRKRNSVASPNLSSRVSRVSQASLQGCDMTGGKEVNGNPKAHHKNGPLVHGRLLVPRSHPHYMDGKQPVDEMIHAAVKIPWAQYVFRSTALLMGVLNGDPVDPSTFTDEQRQILIEACRKVITLMEEAP